MSSIYVLSCNYCIADWFASYGSIFKLNVYRPGMLYTHFCRKSNRLAYDELTDWQVLDAICLKTQTVLDFSLCIFINLASIVYSIIVP